MAEVVGDVRQRVILGVNLEVVVDKFAEASSPASSSTTKALQVGLVVVLKCGALGDSGVVAGVELGLANLTIVLLCDVFGLDSRVRCK